MAFLKNGGAARDSARPCTARQLPEPTEIACIEVTKIYDACSQRLCLDNIPPITFVPTSLTLTPSFWRM